MKKTCSVCKQELLIEKFMKDPRLKCGYKAQCKPCYNLKVRKRYKENPESRRKSIEIHRIYYKKFPERFKKYRDTYLEKNYDKLRASVWKSREKIRKKIIIELTNGDVKCKFCGIIDIRVLALDHVKDDGARCAKISKTGKRFRMNCVDEIIDRKKPLKDYQVLCHNCNFLKEYIRRENIRKLNPHYLPNV